jgi:hypothetical protein
MTAELLGKQVTLINRASLVTTALIERTESQELPALVE